jgi:hypothetical protein
MSTLGANDGLVEIGSEHVTKVVGRRDHKRKVGRGIGNSKRVQREWGSSILSRRRGFG